MNENWDYQHRSVSTTPGGNLDRIAIDCRMRTRTSSWQVTGVRSGAIDTVTYIRIAAGSGSESRGVAAGIRVGIGVGVTRGIDVHALARKRKKKNRKE